MTFFLEHIILSNVPNSIRFIKLQKNIIEEIITKNDINIQKNTNLLTDANLLIEKIKEEAEKVKDEERKIKILKEIDKTIKIGFKNMKNIIKQTTTNILDVENTNRLTKENIKKQKETWNEIKNNELTDLLNKNLEPSENASKEADKLLNDANIKLTNIKQKIDNIEKIIKKIQEIIKNIPIKILTENKTISSLQNLEQDAIQKWEEETRQEREAWEKTNDIISDEIDNAEKLQQEIEQEEKQINTEKRTINELTNMIYEKIQEANNALLNAQKFSNNPTETIIKQNTFPKETQSKTTILGTAPIPIVSPVHINKTETQKNPFLSQQKSQHQIEQQIKKSNPITLKLTTTKEPVKEILIEQPIEKVFTIELKEEVFTMQPEEKTFSLQPQIKAIQIGRGYNDIKLMTINELHKQYENIITNISLSNEDKTNVDKSFETIHVIDARLKKLYGLAKTLDDVSKRILGKTINPANNVSNVEIENVKSEDDLEKYINNLIPQINTSIDNNEKARKITFDDIVQKMNLMNQLLIK